MTNLRYSYKYNMVAFLKKPTESVGFTEIVDFRKGNSLRTLAKWIQELVASIDTKEYTITEASIGRVYVPLLPAMLAGAAQDQGKVSTNLAEPHHTPIDPIPSTSQPPILSTIEPPHSSPPRSHEAPLPEELHHTKNTYRNAILALVERVKFLEAALKRKTKKVVLSNLEDEETENQGRKIQDIDDDPLVSLVIESMKEKEADFVTPTKASASGEAQEEDISPTILEAAQTLSKVASQSVSRYKRRARSANKDKYIGTGLDFFSAAKERLNSAKYIDIYNIQLAWKLSYVNLMGWAQHLYIF
ncbi:hypothetical protein Tco_0886161 [Tanacetum coccineum]